MHFERRSRPGLGGLMLLALLPACGDFVESRDDAPRLTIDQQGGAITLASLTLDIPAGAVGAPVTFAVTAEERPGLASPAYVVAPTGTAFAKPAHVSIAFDATKWPHPVEMFLVDLTMSTAHPLADQHPEAGRVTAAANSAGTFAVLNCPGGVCPAMPH
jgi:hypothetical protein